METLLVEQLCSSLVFGFERVMTLHALLMEFEWKALFSVMNKHFAHLHNSPRQEGYLFSFIAMVSYYNEMVSFIHVSNTLLKLLRIGYDAVVLTRLII